jgi:hypothetical protein
MLTRPIRDARRFPSTRWYPVPSPWYGPTRTTLGFGICPSSKGHFLSRRAEPFRYDSQLARRCIPPSTSQSDPSDPSAHCCGGAGADAALSQSAHAVARGAAPLGGGGSLPRGTLSRFLPAVSKAAPPSQPSERQVKRARDPRDDSSETIAMFGARASTASRAAALPPPQVGGMGA